MPPKKNGRQTNNKKKQNRGAGHGKTSRPTANPPNRGGETTDGPALEGTLPSMSEFQRRSPIHQDYPTVYQRYKDATRRFIAYMEKQGIPEGCTMSVNTLMIIADQMQEERRTVDPLALKDLKLSIRIRSRVAKSLFGGGDSGHKHLLTVLVYCWTVLVSLPLSSTAEEGISTHENEEPSSSQENRFAAFQSDIEDDDSENLDDMIFPTSVPRPEPEPDPMSLEDLMRSDERNDAILFLLSLDEIMGYVVEQYQAIVRAHRSNKAQNIPHSAVVEELIEAAVATNMCIQQVQRLDMELQLQYPHLTTPYRVLSTVVLPEITEEVAAVLRGHASENFTSKDIIVFLGDCLECSFRNVSDPFNRAGFIVPEFCTKYKVDSHGTKRLHQLVKGLHNVTVFEVPLAAEKRQNQIPSYLSPSWLANMPLIGGGRAIHHTIRLLQLFGQVIKDTPDANQVNARQGFFGSSPWIPGRSSKIAGDLDELLMADILPRFITMFRLGILGKTELPMAEEIAPLWLIIRSYIRHPEKTVSWSLAFSVHAMLTAVLETDQITESLMSISEVVFKNFFAQVEWASMIFRVEPDSLDDPKLQHNVRVVLFLKNLGLPVSGRRAIWNPLCAGTTFSYLAFFGSLEAGKRSGG